MPILYQHTINSGAKLAVWDIQEPIDYFRSQLSVPLKISHPLKQRQHLAGRLLLRHLLPSFPVEHIQLTESGKPILNNHSLHFSISHCDHYAAAIVHDKNSCGIDIECITPKALRIIHKFLSTEEQAKLLGNRNALTNEEIATLSWSMKEALFKWYGKGGVDFKDHLEILELKEEGFASCRFQKDESVMLNVYFKKMNDFFLSWVV